MSFNKFVKSSKLQKSLQIFAAIFMLLNQFIPLVPILSLDFAPVQALVDISKITPTISNPADASSPVGTQVCSPFTSKVYNYGSNLLLGGDFENGVGVGGTSVPGPGWTSSYTAASDIYAFGAGSWAFFTTNAGQATGGDAVASTIPAQDTKSVIVNVGPVLSTPIFSWANVPLINGETYVLTVDTAVANFPYSLAVQVDGAVQTPLTVPTVSATWVTTQSQSVWGGTTGNHTVTINSNDTAGSGNDHAFDDIGMFQGTPVIPTVSPAGATINSLGNGNYNVCYTPTSTTPQTFTVEATDNTLRHVSQDVVFTGTLPNMTNTKTTTGATSRVAGDVINSTIVVGNTGQAPGTSVVISDPVPSTPTGTTRTWTASVTGTVSPAIPATGTGSILLTGLTVSPGAVITFSVSDTVISAGSYQNCNTVTGGNTPVAGLVSCGQTDTVSAAPTPNMTLTKSTAGGVSHNIGDVIVSTVTVTNTGNANATAVDILDSIPPNPTGTTRSWTSVITGSVTPAPATSGTSDINQTGLTFAPNANIVYTVSDTVTATGVYTNCSKVTGGGVTIAGGLQQCGTSSAVSNAPVPNLTVTKTTAGTVTRQVGDVITSTITVTNTGNADATATDVADAIPAAPTGTTRAWTSVQTGGVTPTPATSGVGAISMTGLTFPASSTLTITINDTVTANGNYTNCANVSGGGLSAALAPCGQTVVVSNVPVSNMAITKTTPAGPYPVGVAIVSTILVSNTGTATGTGVNVSDPIPSTPAGTTRTFTRTLSGGATGLAGMASGTGNITDTVDVPVGGTVLYTVNDTPTAVGAGANGYQNSVTLNGGSPVTGNAKADVVAPNVTITKSTPAGNYILGNTIVSTLTVENTGTAAASGQDVSDAIPSTPVGTTRSFTRVLSGGATGLAGMATGTGDINDTLTLPVNGKAVYTINDTPTAVGSGANGYQNSATLNNGTPVTGNAKADVIAPTITLTKTTPPGVYLLGSVITSIVTVQNTGTSSGTAVVVDAIPTSPTGTTRAFTSVSTGGATGATASGTLGINDTLTLPAGAKVVYTVNDTPTQIGDYQNTATLDGGTPVPGNSIGTVVTPQLTINKTTPAGPYNINVPITSTIVVGNGGGAQGTAVISDPIPATPAGTTRTFTSIMSGGATGATASGTGAINDTLTMPSGGNVVYTVIDTPTAVGSGANGYQNSVTLNGGTPVTGNAQADVIAPQVTIVKSTPAGPYPIGSTINSTLTVENVGTAAAPNQVVSDPVPSTPTGIIRTFARVLSGGATGLSSMSVGNGAINDTLQLPVGGKAVYSVHDTPTVVGAGTNGYQNTATLNGGTPVTGNAKADVTGPSIVTTKTTPAGPYILGSTITSTVTVQNSGTSAGNATIVDNIPSTPPGTTRTFTSVSTGGATGATPSGTTSINDTVALPVGGKVVYTVNDTPTDIGNYQNSVTVNGGTPITGNSASPVVAPNISITKSTPAGPYTVGTAIVSSVVVTNNGGTTGTAVVVDAIPALPAGTTRSFTSTATGGATGASASGTGNINDTITMPQGSTVVYTVSDTPVVAGTYQNIATVNGGPNVPGGPAGTVNAPSITLTKTTNPGPWLVGSHIVSSLTVENTGTSSGTTLVSDPIPATPTGTTRSFTTTITGSVTGATASGNSNINDTITLAAGAKIVYLIDDVPHSTGSGSNGYQNSATLNGGTPVTGSPKADVTAAAINLTKTTPAGPYLLGTAIVSTLTIQNTGTSAGSGLVADPIPATPAGTTRTFTSVATGGASGNTTSGNGNINETVTLPVGGKVVYTVNDTPTAIGNYQNVATLDGGPNINGNNPGSVVAPNISVTKSTPAGPYPVGSAIVSTIVVSNSGGASGIRTVNDAIPSTPAGTTRSFTSIASGGATGASASGTGSINDTLTMPAGSSVVYTVNDTPTAVGAGTNGYQNSVTLNAGTPVTGNSKFDVIAPSVSITKTTPAGPYVVGTAITSTITVQNSGTSTATGQDVTDAIPSTPAGTTRTFTRVLTGGATGLATMASGTGSINDTLTIPVGGKAVYTVNDTPTAVGTGANGYQNSASLNSGTPVTGNAKADVTAPVIAGAKVTPAGPYILGSVITSTITVQNNGTSTGTATVVDNIPANPAGTTRTYTSTSTGGATGATASGTGNISDTVTLPANGKVVYTVNDTPTVVGTYQNFVVINGGTPISGNNPGQVVAPNITVTKTTPPGPYFVGTPIVSTIVVSNTGGSAGTAAVVSDPVPTSPTGTTRSYTSISTGGATGATGSPTAGTGAINDNLTLPAGSSVVYTISDTATTAGTVAASTGYQNTVTVTPSGGTAIVKTGNVPGDVLTPQITASKVTDPGPYVVGKAIRSVIKVKNNGTSVGTANVVDQFPTVPSGTTRSYTASITAGSGATGFTASGTSAIIDTVTLPVGCEVTYIVNDTMSQSGDYQNILKVNGGPNVPGTPTPQPVVNVTKVTDPGPYVVGKPIHSTVTITNAGSGTSTGVTVVDPIPTPPTGTTRAFTSSVTGGATGNTATGTTGINDTLTIPAGATVTYSINDTMTQSGDYQNKVTVDGGPAVPGTATPQPVVNVTKVTAAGPYFVGKPIQSTITVTNSGTSTANGVIVADNVPATPAGTTRAFTSSVTGGATGNTASGIISINDTLTMPAGSTVVYIVNDTPTQSGDYQNNVKVDNGPNVPGSANSPVISITKSTAPGPYSVGTAIVSTVTVKNQGTVSANGINVVDAIPTVPAGTIRSYISTATAGSIGNTSGSTDINDTLTLPAGAVVTYTIRDTPVVGGTYQNFVAANGGTPIPGTPTALPVIDISKDTPAGPYAVGSPIVSKITVKNTSSVNATGVNIVDAIPALPAGNVRSFTSVAIGSATGNTASGNNIGINDTLNLPAGSNVVYTVTDTTVNAGTYQNFVTINGGSQIPGTPGGILPPPGGPVPPASPVIDVKKDTPAGPYILGNSIVSTITLKNVSTLGATGVKVVDPIPATPAGTTRSYTSVATLLAAGNTLTGTSGIDDTLTLPAGSSVVYTVTDTPIASGDYQNFVTVAGGKPIPGTPGGVMTKPGDPDPKAGAVVEVKKDTPAGPYVLGSAIKSIITVKNSGTVAAPGVKVVDAIPAIPAGTTRTYSSVATNGATGNTGTGTTGIDDTLNLPGGSSVVYTVLDTPIISGNYQNSMTVNGTVFIGTPGGTPIPNPPSYPVIEVKKDTPAGPYVVGQTVTSTITVKNLGSVAANSVKVTDPIPATPAGTTRSYVSVASAGVTGNTSGNTGIDDTLNLPIGAIVTYTVKDTVLASGDYQNFVNVLGSKIPGTPGGVLPKPGVPMPAPTPVVNIVKDTPAGPYETGVEIVSTLTVTNSSTVAANGFGVSDPIPTSPSGTTRTYTSTAVGGASGNTGSGTADINDTLSMPAGSKVVYLVKDTAHKVGNYQNFVTANGVKIPGTPGGTPIPPGGTIPPAGIVNSANIVTTKDTPSGPYLVGKVITSTVTITNTGNATARDVHANDAVPSNPVGNTRTYTSTVSGNATGNTASGTGDINDVLTLAPGAKVVYITKDIPVKTGNYVNVVKISSPADIPGATKDVLAVSGTAGGVVGASMNTTVIGTPLATTGNDYTIYFFISLMSMVVGSAMILKRKNYV